MNHVSISEKSFQTGEQQQLQRSLCKNIPGVLVYALDLVLSAKNVFYSFFFKVCKFLGL